MSKNRIEDFWLKVNKDGTQMEHMPTLCWDWIGYFSSDYGQFDWNGKKPMAHRFSYELAYGLISKGLETHHLCHNKKCVNPDHLELVTHQGNMDRWATEEYGSRIAKRR